MVLLGRKTKAPEGRVEIILEDNLRADTRPTIQPSSLNLFTDTFPQLTTKIHNVWERTTEYW